MPNVFDSNGVIVAARAGEPREMVALPIALRAVAVVVARRAVDVPVALRAVVAFRVLVADVDTAARDIAPRDVLVSVAAPRKDVVASPVRGDVVAAVVAAPVVRDVVPRDGVVAVGFVVADVVRAVEADTPAVNPVRDWVAVSRTAASATPMPNRHATMNGNECFIPFLIITMISKTGLLIQGVFDRICNKNPAVWRVVLFCGRRGVRGGAIAFDKCNATLVQIIGRHFNANLFPDIDPNACLAHFAAYGCQYFMPVFQANPEHSVG